ncbi:MAG: adenosine kinase [Syntrophothermus sp.]
MKRILGMGNALVDILIPIEKDDILEKLELPKGSMQLVDLDRSHRVLNFLEGSERSLSAGGSAANTIHGLAKMGAEAGYIGVIGEDETGGYFVQDMINAGVDPHMIHSAAESGKAIALISPDSERTFATFLGAAIELSAQHLNNGDYFTEVFKKYHYFHLEGYLVINHELVETALKIARANNMIISLDLASYNVVEGNLEFLKEILKNYVDIVFANEEEAKAFTGKEPREALEELGKHCKIAVVKTGAKGSMIKSGEEVFYVDVIPVRPVDTTGAGDLYASGFLYGHSRDLPLQRCGEIGSILAGNVISVIGAKMSKEQWDEIHKML